MTTPFTTESRITKRVSQLGVDLRVEHDVAALDDVIEDASAEVRWYLPQYDETALAASDWVQKKATDLAVYFLCGLRLNPVPDSAQALYDEAVKQLSKVQDGKAVIPGIARGKSAAPTVSNFRVDLQRYPGIRVERPRSTGQKDDGRRQRTDPGAEVIDSG
jgi:phage gp36-like protein